MVTPSVPSLDSLPLREIFLVCELRVPWLQGCGDPQSSFCCLSLALFLTTPEYNDAENGSMNTLLSGERATVSRLEKVNYEVAFLLGPLESDTQLVDCLEEVENPGPKVSTVGLNNFLFGKAGVAETSAPSTSNGLDGSGFEFF